MFKVPAVARIAKLDAHPVLSLPATFPVIFNDPVVFNVIAELFAARNAEFPKTFPTTLAEFVPVIDMVDAVP
jgi:hypothetical protein